MIKKLFSKIILSLVLCFFLFPAIVFAGDATLAWDPPYIPTDVTGYKIHYGTASGTYSMGIDVGNSTVYTVSNLIDGQTYYFTVTAYNAAGVESAVSNEVFKLAAATTTTDTTTTTTTKDTITFTTTDTTTTDTTTLSSTSTRQDILKSKKKAAALLTIPACIGFLWKRRRKTKNFICKS